MKLTLSLFATCLPPILLRLLGLGTENLLTRAEVRYLAASGGFYFAEVLLEMILVPANPIAVSGVLSKFC